VCQLACAPPEAFRAGHAARTGLATTEPVGRIAGPATLSSGVRFSRASAASARRLSAQVAVCCASGHMGSACDMLAKLTGEPRRGANNLWMTAGHVAYGGDRMKARKSRRRRG